MTDVICAGGLFLSKETKRFLFLLRAQGKTANTWGLIGGRKDPCDLTPYDILMREINEEVGTVPLIRKVIPLELFVSKDQRFQYNTYVLLIDNEFIPTLNFEHQGYAWCDYGFWPKPLHQGVRNCLSNKIIKSKLELLRDLI